MHAKTHLIATFVAAALTATALAAPALTKRDAESMRHKIETINELAEQPRKPARTPPHRTVITENEVNAYFTFDAARDLPPGVVAPSISIVGDGRLSGRALVDFDAVRKASPPKSLLDPKNLLAGRIPLTATGVLTTSNGTGRFALESASAGSLPLPKLLLDEIVGYYSRTPGNPNGFSLDSPFPLPAGIREVQITRGQAVVVQ
ncbi:MAG TPA: hypothetical protein VG871_01465 [Vicinamibacterales bacterium]|nr:hypothetical protein [Vicinamibacterales bacterium]